MDPATDWLHHSPINLLVDYYTEVQFRPYGSGLREDEVVPWLRQAKLGYVCIYAKGHSGYTTWHSRLGTAHTMLARDQPAFWRKATRAAGTRLVLYVSGLLDGIAGQRHPEWVQQDLTGAACPPWFTDFKCTQSYALCPQSAYWNEWMLPQLEELLSTYEPDGIWVDGDWPGPCYCPRCRTTFAVDTGWSGTWDEQRKRPDFAGAYARTWNRLTHTWRSRFSATVKRLRPGCAYSAGNVSPRREAASPFDWRSGDFFSPGLFQLHDLARMLAWYDGLGTPADAYLCDSNLIHARKHRRTRSKPTARMLQESAMVLAQGAAVGYWTYPMPDGAFLPSRTQRLLKVADFVHQRAALSVNTLSGARCAVLCSDPGAGVGAGSSPGLGGAIKVLQALHRPADIIDEDGLPEAPPWDLILLPEQSCLPERTVAILERFVRHGGRLLSTGRSTHDPLVARLCGIHLEQPAALADAHVLIAGLEDPCGICAPWDRYRVSDSDSGAGADALLPLARSWDDLNPECRNLTDNWPMHGLMDERHPQDAGFAAAFLRQLGTGTVLHFAAPIFGEYLQLGDPQLLALARWLLDRLDPEPWLMSDAPPCVIFSARRTDESLLIHVVNGNPGRETALVGGEDLWVDAIPVLGPFHLRLRLPAPPCSARWEPQAAPADGTWRDGYYHVTLPSLEIHTCLCLT